MFENPYDLRNKFKEKYSYERENTQEADIGDFQKLNDYISKNANTELWNWTMQQEEVKKSESLVMAHFNNFMFEMIKPQFAKYCKENNIDVIKNYVDTAINTSKEYVSPSEKYEKEINQRDMIMQQQAEQIKMLTQQVQTINKSEVIKI